MQAPFFWSRVLVEILVRPLQRVIHVEPGTNLLASLREQQIPVSYSCMAGRCGTCRCRLMQGDAPGTEVLACQTHVTAACTIDIPEPNEIVVHPARSVKAMVLSIEKLTHDICLLRLKPPRPLAFSPGQYVQLQFGPDLMRPYSMAGLPDDDTLEFHVRVVPGGRVSNFVATELRPGAAVKVSGPLGTSYLRRKQTGPMLCVAGGTGLAPVLSIVRGALQGGMRCPVHLYLGVRSPRDVYGLPWLKSLASDHSDLHVHVVVTAGAEPGQRSGLVTDAVRQDWANLHDARAYLCGSPPMVEAAMHLVLQLGLAPDRVHADAFYNHTI